MALAKALERARKADKAKSNFMFNMSHDIRTPMNAVLDEPTPFRISSVYGTSVACIYRVGGIDGFVVLMVPYHVLGGVTRALIIQSIIAIFVVLLFFLFYMRSLYLVNRRLRDETEGKHLNVINALTESYGTAFIVDMNTGLGECYSIDDTLLSYMHDAFEKNLHYDQQNARNGVL